MEASIYVAVNTLEYLKKSGRVTAAGRGNRNHSESEAGSADSRRQAGCLPKSERHATGNADHDRRTETRPDGRFAGQKLTIRAAYSGDAEAGAAWQAELQKAFPEMTIGLNPPAHQHFLPHR